MPEDGNLNIKPENQKYFTAFALMGTDAPESMAFKLDFGNNVYLNLSQILVKKLSAYLTSCPLGVL